MILQDNIAYLKELEEDLARCKLGHAPDNVVAYLQYRVDVLRGLVETKPEDDGGECASDTASYRNPEVSK